VGINSQIYSRTGGYQGLSFAIPIEIATKVKDQIVSTGKVSHARLGVSIQEVNQAFADSFKLDKPEGALISSVEADSPAEKAGLKSGDVIRKVNGQPVIASGDLPAVIGQSTPGEKVTLDVWRQGRNEVIQATLGGAKDKATQTAKAEGEPGKGKLGLALRPLQPQEKQSSGLSGGLLIDRAGSSRRCRYRLALHAVAAARRMPGALDDGFARCRSAWLGQRRELGSASSASSVCAASACAQYMAR
jgi:serine protease Do